jgi:hypothetical protein
LKYHRRAEFSRAIKQFGEALALNSGDTLCATYIKLCETLMANPPEPGWNGVRVMKSK